MATKSALELSKADGAYTVMHRGYPVGGLLRFHCTLGVAAALLTVPLFSELEPRLAQGYFALTFLLLAYAVGGYFIYLPFAGLRGGVRIVPTDEAISYHKSVFSIPVVVSRQIPWEGTLEVEVERFGWQTKLLPLNFTKIKIVTDFMTYHVATFGPGLQGTAEDMAKAIKKARYGRKIATSGS